MDGTQKETQSNGRGSKVRGMSCVRGLGPFWPLLKEIDLLPRWGAFAGARETSSFPRSFFRLFPQGPT